MCTRSIIYHDLVLSYPRLPICTNSQSHQHCTKVGVHRLPFPRSMIRSIAKFQLIYVDLWDRYSVQTFNKSRYVITLVETFTRTTWTHLLSCKSNAFEFIKYFISLFDTHFHNTIHLF